MCLVQVRGVAHNVSSLLLNEAKEPASVIPTGHKHIHGAIYFKNCFPIPLCGLYWSSIILIHCPMWLLGSIASGGVLIRLPKIAQLMTSPLMQIS